MRGGGERERRKNLKSVVVYSLQITSPCYQNTHEALGFYGKQSLRWKNEKLSSFTQSRCCIDRAAFIPLSAQTTAFEANLRRTVSLLIHSIEGNP